MTFTKSGGLKGPLNFHKLQSWKVSILAILAMMEPLIYNHHFTHTSCQTIAKCTFSPRQVVQ